MHADEKLTAFAELESAISRTITFKRCWNVTILLSLSHPGIQEAEGDHELRTTWLAPLQQVRRDVLRSAREFNAQPVAESFAIHFEVGTVDLIPVPHHRQVYQPSSGSQNALTT